VSHYISHYIFGMGHKPKKTRGRQTGHRINGRGSLRLDRVFPLPVGRIARASGTNDYAVFQQMEAMLVNLYEQGKSGILQEIRDGHQKPLQVFEKWSRGELAHLNSAAALRDLLPTYTKWVPTHRNHRTGLAVKDTTKKNYLEVVRRFVRRVGNIAIHEIPEAMRRYQPDCEQRGVFREFNQLRTALLAFLASEFKGSKLQADLKGVRKLQEPVKGRPDHLSVAEAVALFQVMDDDAKAIARTMATTGMNWEEYAGDWEVVSLAGGLPAVRILGTKTKNRPRTIPVFEKNISKPSISKGAFEYRLDKAMKKLPFQKRISPSSFRLTFARWMADAGIPSYRRKDYMGHKHGDMTERYEMGVVLGYFKDDADMWHNYMEEQSKPKPHTEPVARSFSGFQFIRPRLKS
jgi:integrase